MWPPCRGYYSGASAIAAQVVPWASLLPAVYGFGAGATGATGGERRTGATAASVGTGGGEASAPEVQPLAAGASATSEAASASAGLAT